MAYATKREGVIALGCRWAKGTVLTLKQVRALAKTKTWKADFERVAGAHAHRMDQQGSLKAIASPSGRLRRT